MEVQNSPKKWGTYLLVLCCIGITYLVLKLNYQTNVHRGVLVEKHEYGWFAGAFLQLRFGRVDKPCRLTVVNEDEEIIQVFGSGMDVAEGSPIYYIEEESLLGFIYYIREE